MKKILGLTIVALLTITVVIGGTYAYFTDTETSVDNTLTAGTLDLNINSGNIAVTTFSVSNVAPGDSGSDNSTLTNVGSLAGELDITTSAITNTPGAGGTEFEGGSGELGAAALLAMYIDVDQSTDWSAGDVGLSSNTSAYNFPTVLDYDPIDDYDSITWDAVETMAASAADYFTALWQIPTATGNNTQGDSVSFDVTFVLEQADND